MKPKRQDAVDQLVEGLPEEVSDRTRLVIELSKRIGHLDATLQRVVQAEVGALGLTYAEFEVLAALSRAGSDGKRPNELARDLLLTTGGLSNVLQRLEDAGLIGRHPDPRDARSKRVRLTDAGLRGAERAVRLASAAQVDVLSTVPDEQLRVASDALRDVGVAAGVGRETPLGRPAGSR